MQQLAPAPGRTILDGTLGGGGHSAALLRAGAKVVALDRDDAAIDHAGATLSEFGDRLTMVRSDFADLGIPSAVMITSFSDFNSASNLIFMVVEVTGTSCDT
ncbi:MAG: 16S rRNA (cytosine(1402)-N(4))-methyltransferase [Flavitalea sp.]